MADNSLKVNTGTALTMASDDISSVHYPRVKISVGADGAAADWQGTINTVANLDSGTIAEVTSVTEVANVAGGTVVTDTTSYRFADEFATVVSSGTSTLGTIKPAVSGSVIYVTDLVVSAGTATNVEIGDGGTSTPILGTMHLADNGGAVMNFKTPIRTTSGSALVYKQSTDGPLTISAQGYVD